MTRSLEGAAHAALLACSAAAAGDEAAFRIGHNRVEPGEIKIAAGGTTIR